jgi:hypothetical protein
MRLFYYITSTAFNILLFYTIFNYGDDKLILFFNKIDIIFAVAPIWMTLGIEKIYIYDDRVIKFRKTIHSSLTKLLLFFLIAATLLSLVYSPKIALGPMLAFIYAHGNINTAYMNIAHSRDRINIFESFVRICALSALIIALHLSGASFTAEYLLAFLMGICTFIVIASLPVYKERTKIFWVINKYYDKVKTILALILLGTLYSNAPRIFELALGSELRSVQFFFWLKLISYVSALGVFFIYFISKSFIRNRGYSELGQLPTVSVLVYSIFIITINFINFTEISDFTDRYKIDSLLLLMISMTSQIVYVKDLYGENLLSLNMYFNRKLKIFLKVIFLTLLTTMFAHYFGLLSTYSMIFALLLSSIYWLILTISAIPPKQRDQKIYQGIMITMVTFIICLVFPLFYKS